MDGKWRSHQKHDLYRTGSRERVFANNIVTALVTPTLLAENLHSNVASLVLDSSAVPVPIPKKYYNYFAAAPIE